MANILCHPYSFTTMVIFQFLKTVLSCLKAIMPLSGCSNPLMTGSSLTFNLCSTVTSSEILFQFNQHNQGLSLSITHFSFPQCLTRVPLSLSLLPEERVCLSLSGTMPGKWSGQALRSSGLYMEPSRKRTLGRCLL